MLGAITANPDRYEFADADIHEGPLRRFPYAVYYRVLAVYHTARDPSGWQSRV